MMKELIEDFKIVKYGFNKVQNLIVMGFFFVMGFIFYLILGLAISNGSMFVMIAPMFLVQLLYSTSMSALVSSSGKHRRLQTIVPAALNLISLLCAYMLLVLGGFLMQLYTGNMERLKLSLLFASFMGATIMIYLAFAYKSFITSAVVFFIVFFFAYSMMNISFFSVDFVLPLSFPIVIILGVAILFLGAGIEYLASLLVYKMPLSTYAMDAAMRRYLTK